MQWLTVKLGPYVIHTIAEYRKPNSDSFYLLFRFSKERNRIEARLTSPESFSVHGTLKKVILGEPLSLSEEEKSLIPKEVSKDARTRKLFLFSYPNWGAGTQDLFQGAILNEMIASESFQKTRIGSGSRPFYMGILSLKLKDLKNGLPQGIRIEDRSRNGISYHLFSACRAR